MRKMNHQIIDTRTIMLGIDLEHPFHLAFGVLYQLPRILYLITVSSGSNEIIGIGEASIDFPFSPYDAWDIYYTLSNLDLSGFDIEDRESLLSNKAIRAQVLENCPAAFAALNMALDDAFGKIYHLSIIDLYGARREGGRALSSVSQNNNIHNALIQIQEKVDQGMIPKIKVGQSIKKDRENVLAIGSYCKEKEIPYALDFNAKYTVLEFQSVIDSAIKKDVIGDQILFIEQPTKVREGISGLKSIASYLKKNGVSVNIVVDEGFSSLNEGIECVQNNFSLNFKIHKIGGAFKARELEDKIACAVAGNHFVSLVGGTFPTAIGRVYDQQCAAILKFATLPSDAWEPSTHWFRGDKHLIKENFIFEQKRQIFLPTSGFGLGITPVWNKIDKFIVKKPRQEYRNIRQGKSGQKTSTKLLEGQTYQKVYESRTGRPWDWNL